MYGVAPSAVAVSRRARDASAGERQRVRGGAEGAASGMVGREVEGGGGPLQVPAPELHLLAEELAPQPLALPEREVGVLHREVGKRRRAPLREGAVQRHHLAQEDAVRPAVGDHVVQHQEEDVLLGAQAEEEYAQEGVALQVEGDGRLGAGQAERLGHRVRGGGHVRGAHLHPRGGEDHLLRAVVAQAEAGAEHLVAPDHLVQGAAQRRAVERAAQPHGQRQVEGRRRGVELVLEPDPLLREGERDRPRALAARDALLLRLRPAQRPEPLLETGQLLGGEVGDPPGLSAHRSALPLTARPARAPAGRRPPAPPASARSPRRAAPGWWTRTGRGVGAPPRTRR